MNELNISIPLQPKQDVAHEAVEHSLATWIGMGGAMGGGKSDMGRRILLKRAWVYPATRHLIIRRISRQLIDNHIVPLWRDYPQLERYFVKNESTLYLPNGSHIVFGHAEHPARDLQGDVYKWQGSEWATIFVDEATHFNEEELSFLRTRCRVVGQPGLIPKLLLTFNPGGLGHSFLKRVFIDRRYEELEDSSDYIFIRAYGWDNIEHCRESLLKQSISEETYYSTWNDEQRRDYFLKNRPYGRILGSMKGKMRLAYLEGDFTAFSGQYFDIFSLDLHVRYVSVEEWHARSIGIDWGFGHNAGVLWGAQTEPDHLHVYREFLGSGRSPRALAQEIVDRTPVAERSRIESIGLSHDAFANREGRDPINVQIDDVLTKAGLPQCHKAGGDPMGTGTKIYDMLGQLQVSIAPNCKMLIETMPEIQHDPKNLKAPAKQVDDDIFEALKHLTEARTGFRPVSEDVQIRAHAMMMDNPVGKFFYLKQMLGQRKSPVVEVDYTPTWFKGGEQ